MTGARHTAVSPPPWKVWSALGAIYVIWGSTYLAIRVMVRDVPPLLGAGVRFVIAGVLLLAIIRLRRGRGAIAVSRRELLCAILVGLLLAAGGNGLVTVAEVHVPSALAALLVATVPLWVIVLRRVAGRERIGAATLASIVVGFCGVALLLLPGSRPAGATLGGMAIVLAAALSWATGSFASPRLELPRDPLLSTGWQLAAGGVALLAMGLVAGEAGHVHPGTAPAAAWLSLAYLVVVGSLIGYSAYSWLLQHVALSRVATYAYVNPVVAVFLGWWLLAEQLSPATLLAAAVIVGSVAVTVRPRTEPAVRKPASAEPPAVAVTRARG
ncbi:MAG TPA: EamA family transporter [Solirubrobacteraceae bacterium]|nr:EamA family transporter [Solirubrobacteraceae bacterium]